MSDIKKRVWTDETGEWYIDYQSICPRCDCMDTTTQPALVVSYHPQGSKFGSISVECWHPRRFLRRARSVTECLFKALGYVAKGKAREQALRDEAEAAVEEAAALADAARTIAGVLA